MSIFKRGKDSKETAISTDVDPQSTDGEPGRAADATKPERADLVLADRSGGPFDATEVAGPEGRLDVGALWLPLVEGIELQLQVDDESQQVTGVFIVLGDSAVQLQAFAAPRTQGIWGEICDEIAASITEQGGTADPGYGRFGRELLARVPAQQPDGKVGFQPMRFTGVNGPRWLLRAVFHGRSAIEPESATAIEDLVAAVVVVRGKDPMGPRELLPLRLPLDSQVEGAPASADDSSGSDAPAPERIAENAAPGSMQDLQPFERGPEITERR